MNLDHLDFDIVSDFDIRISYFASHGTSTSVEDSLQIRLFMQNEPNFRKSQMNVNKVLTKDYVNKTLGEHGKNKAKTKPNKANLLNAQMNVNKVLTKDYVNKSSWAIYENKANFNPKQTQSNPISPPHAAKRTQFKPNTNPIKANFRGKKMLLHLTINGLRNRVLIFYVKSGFYSDAPELAFCLRNTIPVLSTFILSEIEVVEGYEIC